MSVKDLDITQFGSIAELYDFLDINALQLECKHDLTDMLIQYRAHTADGNEKQLAQWELECFLINFLRNQPFAFSTSNGKEPGEVYQYPNLDEFQQAAFDYVKQRATSAKNPLLKATYSHLLWKAPAGIKHKQFAVMALDNYIAVIEHYIELFSADQNEENYYQITRKLENLVALSAEVNERSDEIRQLTNQLLFDVESLKFYHKESILSTMLDYPGLFKAGDFAGTLTIFEEALQDQSKRTDYFMMANDWLKTAIRIATKTGQDLKRWHNEVGECFVRLAETETDEERSWIKQSIYTQSILAFRQAGNTRRRQEVELLHDQLKKNVKLENVEIPYDEATIAGLKEWQKDIESVTAAILEHSSEVVYDHIAKGKFFPTKEFLEKHASGLTEPWLQGVKAIKFDINKNIRSLGGEENSKEGFWYQYRFQMKHTILPYLHQLFVPGIQSGKLTYRNLFDHLTNNTWLGQTFTKMDLGGEPVRYNWVSLVSPAITEYFVQMQAALLQKTYRPNFILSIDSLTLKMEGLLRDFCQKLNVNTSKGSQTGVQVRYIHELLQDEIIQQYFSEEDRIFFDFLFANKEGIDLRNNIAHCFYDYQDYSFDQMHLLMTALLRIGKYKFKAASKK